MFGKFPAYFFLLSFFAFIYNSAAAQSSDDIKLGIGPVEPFRIAGNLYYIGSNDITSYLIVTAEGNIILDSGMKEMLPQLKANIAKLGFRLEDTKVILNSHAHFDHAGGIAELRRSTKARFLASELDEPLLKRGGLDDPNFGDRYPFESTPPDAVFKNGEKVRLGRVTLTANINSGHTKGCTTWTTSVHERNRNFNVIFVCSVSAPGYKLVGNAKYPDIEADYYKSFAWFLKAKVEIFLGSHAGFFDLEGKAKQLRAGSKSNPFVDPKGYREFIERNAQAFREKLNLQKNAGN